MKDVLVHVDATARGESRLRLAADLARRQGCRLSVLFVKDRSVGQIARRKAAEIGLAPACEIDKLDRLFDAANDAGADRIHAVLETLQAEAPFEAEWRCLTGSAAAIVPQHARVADLCIVGQDVPPEDDAPSNGCFAEQMLFITGRPVLFVPSEGTFPAVGRRIVIAWNASRGAARAVSDALPLLALAGQSTLLTIGKVKTPAGAHALPGEAILDHLQRHGVRIEAQRIQTGGATIAETLLDAAHACGADLIVAGAYGHSRMWERLLGGVTRDLLAQMTLPLLMSH